MGNVSVNIYNPDYTIHPGEILEETLEARGIKKNELAKRCGLAPKTISQIINGKASISPSVAIRLERAIGVSASLWTNLATDYDLHKARVDDQKRLELRKQWVKHFPLKQLIEWEILEKKKSLVDSLSDVLSFFGVSNISAWEDHYLNQNVAYRKSQSYKSEAYHTATWLRIGEKLSENTECSTFDKNTFKSSLIDIRNSTNLPVEEFLKVITQKCCDSGVSLVFVPEFPKTRISGATKWLSKDKAMIILSLRHKSDDHFWFSFFHETAHILLHGKTDTFIDSINDNKNKKEIEADEFASKILIPLEQYQIFKDRGLYSQEAIESFAKKLGIAPGIVVGRLQHDKLVRFNWHNSLKRKFEFKNTPTY